MFTIKKGLKEANQLFFMHKGQLLAFAFGWAILVATTLYFSYLYGLLIVAIFFIALPLELSLVTISKKVADRIAIGNRDFYIGFRALMLSISLYAKMMLKGFIWAVLIGTGLSLIGSAFVLFQLAPDIFALGDYQAMIEAMMANTEVIQALTISSIVSFLLAGVLYQWHSFQGQMAPFVLLDTGFDIVTCYTLSMRLSKNEKKILRISKLLFYAYYAAAFLVGVIGSYALGQIPMMNPQFVGFIGFFVVGLLIAPVHMIANFYYYAFYQHFYQEKVKKHLQDYINVKMRINERDFVDSKYENKEEPPAKTKSEEEQDKQEK